ncbi:MAG TPA: glycosyltransferase, partial [Candidatus Kapabacteria bacterium]
LIDGVNCLVRNTDEEMASACAELLRDEEKRLRLTRAGRALIEERYTWDTIFDQFDDVIGSLVPNFFYSNELMQAA